MQSIVTTSPTKTALLKVTPNQLREIANNLEKEGRKAESKESVILPINPSLSFVYYPSVLDQKESYGSKQEFTPEEKEAYATADQD